MNCRFKELRIRKGLTQEEFRQDFNLQYFRNYTPSAISLFENNKRVPEISALIDFADYFNVSLDYLLRHETSGTCFPFPEAAPPPALLLTKKENDLLEGYRALSHAGKDIVETTLQAILRHEKPEDDIAIEKKATS